MAVSLAAGGIPVSAAELTSGDPVFEDNAETEESATSKADLLQKKRGQNSLHQ